MMIGAMLCSSLKTSDVLEVKAAEAWAPGMVWTDVGGIKEKSLMSCFLGQRYERCVGEEKKCILCNAYNNYDNSVFTAKKCYFVNKLGIKPNCIFQKESILFTGFKITKI